MPSFLNVKELTIRSSELSRENLKFIFGLIKAISLGAATISLFNILAEKGVSNPDIPFDEFWMRFLLWLISCVALIVTYDGAMFGTIFLTHIPGKTETVVTYVVVILEFSLFAILTPKFFLEVNHKDATLIFGVAIVDYWYLIFGVYCLCAFVLILDGRKNINKNIFREPVLSLVTQYKKKMNNQIISSFFTGTGCIFLFLWLRKYPFKANVLFYFIATLLVFSSLCAAFFQQHSDRTEFEKELKNLNDADEGKIY